MLDVDLMVTFFFGYQVTALESLKRTLLPWSALHLATRSFGYWF
jgi:hypothetical protein